MRRPILVVMALLAAAAPGAAESVDGFLEQGARRIARACAKGGLGAVAIAQERMPGPGEPAVDRELSARLLTKLLHLPKPPDCAVPGRAPDAVVVVRHRDLGDDMEVGLRLLGAGGRELYGASARVRNEWLGRAPAADRRPDCADAAGRVDSLQHSILDLKARHWARRMRFGYSRDEGRQRPAEMISNPRLADDFEAALRRWLKRRRIPELDRDEVRRLVAAEADSHKLFGYCRLADASSHQMLAGR